MDLESSVDSRARETEEATVLRFPAAPQPKPVAFDRHELTQILDLYGRHVADGEWRDYAMEFGREAASFAIFRRASEPPLYRIVKIPRQKRAQCRTVARAASASPQASPTPIAGRSPETIRAQIRGLSL